MGGFDEPTRLIADAVANKKIPGATFRVDVGGKLAYQRAFGTSSLDTIYDLASVTKCAATASVAALMVQDGRLELDRRVADYLPDFADTADAERRAMTVRHLLTHTAGFPAGGAFAGKTLPLRELIRAVGASRRTGAPGEKFLYSDFSAITLGAVLEAVAGDDLRFLCRERIYRPLGMTDTLFRPGWRQIPRCAPCLPDIRDRGRVHDPTAAAAERGGYVTGHAGLFSTAADLARLSQAWLGRVPLLSESIRREFTREQAFGRALGWDRDSAYSIRATLSPSSFGHTGFTGTAIWIDPTKDLVMILLTNAAFGGDAARAACIPLRRAVNAALAKNF